MKIFIGIFTILAVGNVFATAGGLTFNLRSTPDGFPCNSGIKYVTPEQNREYSLAGEDCVGDPNCNSGMSTSTNLSTGSSNLMRAHLTNFSPTTNITGETSFISKNSKEGWQTLLTSDSLDLSLASSTVNDVHRITINNVSYNKQITSLDFSFSSEQFGAQYFVDICNYFPEKYCNYGGHCDFPKEKDLHWNYGNVISATLSSDLAINYLNNTDLRADIELYCDGELFFSLPNQKVNKGLSLPFNYDFTSMLLKKCVTRFTFRETKSSIRINQGQGAAFEVLTNMENAI